MPKITIQEQGDDAYDVTVHAGRTTTHRVTCTPKMIEDYAPGTDPQALLRASFEFLLERESNTSIMSSFDLPVIERYFPEYRPLIATRLEG
jgi:hypothetical protein